MEFDTAGQENMFPVVTKAYEVGSKSDTASTGGANLAIGVGAGIIAVGAIAAGLLVLGNSGEQLQAHDGAQAAACHRQLHMPPYPAESDVRLLLLQQQQQWQACALCAATAQRTLQQQQQQ